LSTYLLSAPASRTVVRLFFFPFPLVLTLSTQSSSIANRPFLVSATSLSALPCSVPRFPCSGAVSSVRCRHAKTEAGPYQGRAGCGVVRYQVLHAFTNSPQHSSIPLPTWRSTRPCCPPPRKLRLSCMLCVPTRVLHARLALSTVLYCAHGRTTALI
jgi:hypothetical protein